MRRCASACGIWGIWGEGNHDDRFSAPGYLEGTRATANLDPAYQEQARMGALLKRAADKDDIAEQVVAFCRTDSITGQTLAIDAGRFFH